MANLQAALTDGHLVTVGALNKVYRYVLNELDKLNERTVDLYQVQGTVKSISDLYSLTSANNGDVYNVKDPVDDFGRGNVTYVCIKQYKIEDGNYKYQDYVKSTDTTPKQGVLYYKKETISNSFTYVPTPVNPQVEGLYIKDYVQLTNAAGENVITTNIDKNYSLIWDSLGGDISKATVDQFGLIKLDNSYAATASAYGLIKTGFNHTKDSKQYQVSLDANDNAYANIPLATNDDSGVIRLGATTKKSDYQLKTDTSGNAYINVPVEMPLSTADNGTILLNFDIGLDKDKNSKLYNSGVISVEEGDDSFSLKFKTGNADKQNISIKDADTIVHSTPSIAVGGSDKPVYINSSLVPTKIDTISLGDISTSKTVATFKTNGATTAVRIEGGSNVTNSTLASVNESAALVVKGGIVATSGITAEKVYHAVWNDISDAIEVQDSLDVAPGFCYYFDGKEYHKTSKYCQKGIIGIHSDTAGDVLGKKGKHKELDIAIGGFVLAHVDREYTPGTPLTSTKDGLLTKMKRYHVVKYPERLVGEYWKPESEEEWGAEDHKVPVCGRHWIKVK